jgi:hypothetical protein
MFKIPSCFVCANICCYENRAAVITGFSKDCCMLCIVYLNVKCACDGLLWQLLTSKVEFPCIVIPGNVK